MKDTRDPRDMKDSDRDFLAVQEDALLVDILATREDLSAFADDHIAQVLGSYAADVDEGLELVVNAQLPEAPRPLTQDQGDTSPRRSARFLIAATTAVVLVGTSGVAAAVTGDPLSPFRSVVKVVSGGGHTPTADPGRISEELPDPASTKAEVALMLNEAKQALKDGDVEKAQRLLDELAADAQIGDGLSPGLEARIDKMQDDVDKSAGGQGGHDGQGGQDTDKPGQGDPQDDKTKHDNQGNTSHPEKPGQGDEKPTKPGQDTKGNGSDGGSDGSQSGSGSSKDPTGSKDKDRAKNDGNGSGKQDDTGTGGKPAGNQSGGGQVKGRPDRGPDKPDKGTKAGEPAKEPKADSGTKGQLVS